MHAEWKTAADHLLEWDKGMRRLRDTILIVAVVWCVLALVFSITMNSTLGIVVIAGAYIGIGAVALFGLLSLIIIRMELSIARGVVRGRFEDSIGLLFQLAESDSERSRRVAIAALRRGLPGVDSLAPYELDAIHSALLSGEYASEPALVIQFLRSLERHGDRSSIEAALRAAEFEPRTRAEGLVRRAALRCVATLKNRYPERRSTLPDSQSTPPHASLS